MLSRPIFAATRFVKTWKGLSLEQKEQVLDVLIALPELLRNPHRHTGFGFRRLHGTWFYEARLDLKWRLVMRVDIDEIILFDVMNHDQIRRLS